MATVIKSKKPRNKRVSKKQAINRNTKLKLSLEEFDKQADAEEPEVVEPEVEDVQDIDMVEEPKVEEPEEKPKIDSSVKRIKKRKSDKKVKAGKSSAKKSKWLQHVREFRKLHPEMKYKDVLKLASKTYEKEQ